LSNGNGLSTQDRNAGMPLHKLKLNEKKHVKQILSGVESRTIQPNSNNPIFLKEIVCHHAIPSQNLFQSQF
jgi:hypothetical protein